MEKKKLKQYQIWIKSLCIRSKEIDIFEESKSFLLLDIFEHLFPKQLDWNLIEIEPKNTYQEISNLNILLKIMKKKGANLSGVSGINIQDGNKVKIGIVFSQLMKLHFLKLEEENQSSNPSNLKNQKKKKYRSLNDEIDEWINLLEIEEDKKKKKNFQKLRI